MKGEFLTLEQLFERLEPGAHVLVSACLLGERTRYDGSHKEDGELLDRLQELSIRITPLCPELAGGLAVPRPAAEPSSGTGVDVLAGESKILTVADGVDVTPQFLSGAKAATATARAVGAQYAILQERSPSCGVFKTHSGGDLVNGPGVAAAALVAAGISVAPSN